MKQQLPIGVFDSGMGGLTVLRALKQQLPQESFIYLGDTARLPYGTKSRETIIKYASQIVELLLCKQIKMLVIACNTASTAALSFLQNAHPELPIVGVIEPGAKTAVAHTQTQHIAVLATETTINSHAYHQAITQLNPEITVTGISCGLFVTLAEEGSVDDELAYVAVKKYLEPVFAKQHNIDSIVLGCTHFPVLKKPIQDFIGNEVRIIDSATATAKYVYDLLTRLDLHNQQGHAVTQYWVTDLPERFIRVGKLFLQHEIKLDFVSNVDL